MKKVWIGMCLFIMGVVETIAIILSASILLPGVTAWDTAYPSKLFFLIFAGRSEFNDGADGLGLGLFFVLGMIFMAVGLVILGVEYFRKESE